MKKAFSLAAVCLSAVVIVRNEGPGLRFEPEGLYLDYNFRDVGKSINDCLELEQSRPMPENVLFRANKWFSGWSCENVGRPDVIVSLNYRPGVRHEYYCREDEGEALVGFHPNQTVEINDIEFLKTWNNPIQKDAICSQLHKVLISLNQYKKVLIHCEAGRDRTGAIAALVAALFLEQHKIPEEKMNAAIECDYRKSRSLGSHKYGRMAVFLDAIRGEHRSVESFLKQRCGIDYAETLSSI